MGSLFGLTKASRVALSEVVYQRPKAVYADDDFPFDRQIFDVATRRFIVGAHVNVTCTVEYVENGRSR